MESFKNHQRPVSANRKGVFSLSLHVYIKILFFYKGCFILLLWKLLTLTGHSSPFSCLRSPGAGLDSQFFVPRSSLLKTCHGSLPRSFPELKVNVIPFVHSSAHHKTIEKEVNYIQHHRHNRGLLLETSSRNQSKLQKERIKR